MNPTNSELNAAEEAIFARLCAKYVQRSDARQQAMGLQYMEAETHDLAKFIAAWNTRKSEALADDAVSVSGLLDWIEQAWPEGSGSDFNQGVVRGFEIIRAQLQEGHIQRYCAALSTLAPSPAVDLLREAREALAGCSKRLRNAAISGGTDEEYADAAVAEYTALLIRIDAAIKEAK